MIKYAIKKYLFSNYKKFFISFIILCFSGVILKYLLQDDGKISTLWDYVFSSFSYPLAIILIIPLVYFYLIGNIFISDYKECNIEFFLLRTSSKFKYFLSKIIIIVLTSNLFFFVFLGILIFIGIIFKFPLKGDYSSNILQCSLYYEENIFKLLFIQYALVTMLLNLIGICILVISLLTNNTIYSAILLILAIVNGRNAICDNNLNMIYSPIAQGVLSYHSPFYFFGLSKDINSSLIRFTTSYSIKYLYLFFIIFFIIGWYRIMTMDFTFKKGDNQ